MPEQAHYLSPNPAEELVTFLRAQHHTLFALCKRWSAGNTADAEDLLGEACLRAFEALSVASQELQSPLGWWATIIANAARDRARKRARGGRASAELSARCSSQAFEDGARLDDHLSMRRGLARVRAQMSVLSNTQRLAVTFRSFGDEYDEIARKLGTSNGNARKLVQVGRRLLRSDCGPLVADYLDRARTNAGRSAKHSLASRQFASFGADGYPGRSTRG